MPVTVHTSKTETTKSSCSVVGNQRGAALILAIVMLVILSILGSVVLMSSGTEMKVSGNYQVAKQTFWVADRAVEYATSRNILMTMGSEVDLMTGVHKTRIEAAGGGVLTEGVIRDLGPGDLPAKIAEAYGTDFGANFYQVSVTAKQKDEPNAAEVHIDTSIVRIFKIDDESIFRTDGEG
jgi:Tfp pilus assembly protein PilX